MSTTGAAAGRLEVGCAAPMVAAGVFDEPQPFAQFCEVAGGGGSALPPRFDAAGSARTLCSGGAATLPLDAGNVGPLGVWARRFVEAGGAVVGADIVGFMNLGGARFGFMLLHGVEGSGVIGALVAVRVVGELRLGAVSGVISWLEEAEEDGGGAGQVVGCDCPPVPVRFWNCWFADCPNWLALLESCCPALVN